MSLSVSDLGSLLVMYLVQYKSMTLRLETMNCMSTLAHHTDSCTGLKLLIIPSLRAVSRVGSSSVTMVVFGCNGLSMNCEENQRREGRLQIRRQREREARARETAEEREVRLARRRERYRCRLETYLSGLRSLFIPPELLSCSVDVHTCLPRLLSF